MRILEVQQLAKGHTANVFGLKSDSRILLQLDYSFYEKCLFLLLSFPQVLHREAASQSEKHLYII